MVGGWLAGLAGWLGGWVGGRVDDGVGGCRVQFIVFVGTFGWRILRLLLAELFLTIAWDCVHCYLFVRFLQCVIFVQTLDHRL